MTQVDVKKVAQLARLELNAEEETYYAEKFQEILGYVDQLAEVEITGELQGKDEGDQQLNRVDEVKKSPVHPEDYSPFLENHFFKVPPIIE